MRVEILDEARTLQIEGTLIPSSSVFLFIVICFNDFLEYMHRLPRTETTVQGLCSEQKPLNFERELRCRTRDEAVPLALFLVLTFLKS